jgi:hypothetical protein
VHRRAGLVHPVDDPRFAGAQLMVVNRKSPQVKPSTMISITGE